MRKLALLIFLCSGLRSGLLCSGLLCSSLLRSSLLLLRSGLLRRHTFDHLFDHKLFCMTRALLGRLDLILVGPPFGLLLSCLELGSVGSRLNPFAGLLLSFPGVLPANEQNSFPSEQSLAVEQVGVIELVLLEHCDLVAITEW